MDQWLDPYDPDFPYGTVAFCEFSEQPEFQCALATTSFAGAKSYALNIIHKYNLEYVVVTTTGIDERPFGVFVDIDAVYEINHIDVRDAIEGGDEVWSEGRAPESHIEQWPYRVNWVDIGADRWEKCGMCHKFEA